ncbi:hypothetical protein RvY_16322 [Ramazzottius varieornatus]|uniref:Secreted protein n=1 Tax=Ramazzottius varieornatus TaxID=947166 RepID=A0A1D1W2F0_RAMVA|nr:hypothetical protein RvY_16322 [Ramazzottius varieornatus]
MKAPLVGLQAIALVLQRIFWTSDLEVLIASLCCNNQKDRCLFVAATLFTRRSGSHFARPTTQKECRVRSDVLTLSSAPFFSSLAWYTKIAYVTMIPII